MGKLTNSSSWNLGSPLIRYLFGQGAKLYGYAQDQQFWRIKPCCAPSLLASAERSLLVDNTADVAAVSSHQSASHHIYTLLGLWACRVMLHSEGTLQCITHPKDESSESEDPRSMLRKPMPSFPELLPDILAWLCPCSTDSI